jgi:hypothetical protein
MGTSVTIKVMGWVQSPTLVPRNCQVSLVSNPYSWQDKAKYKAEAIDGIENLNKTQNLQESKIFYIYINPNPKQGVF